MLHDLHFLFITVLCFVSYFLSLSIKSCIYKGGLKSYRTEITIYWRVFQTMFIFNIVSLDTNSFGPSIYQYLYSVSKIIFSQVCKMQIILRNPRFTKKSFELVVETEVWWRRIRQVLQQFVLFFKSCVNNRGTHLTDTFFFILNL